MVCKKSKESLHLSATNDSLTGFADMFDNEHICIVRFFSHNLYVSFLRNHFCKCITSMLTLFLSRRYRPLF